LVVTHWSSLAEDLAELERTDPVVREAKRRYDETCAAILAKPRPFDTGALPAFLDEDDQ
jgi:hypothetical protein